MLALWLLAGAVIAILYARVKAWDDAQEGR